MAHNGGVETLAPCLCTPTIPVSDRHVHNTAHARPNMHNMWQWRSSEVQITTTQQIQQEVFIAKTINNKLSANATQWLPHTPSPSTHPDPVVALPIAPPPALTLNCKSHPLPTPTLAHTQESVDVTHP